MIALDLLASHDASLTAARVDGPGHRLAEVRVYETTARGWCAQARVWLGGSLTSEDAQFFPEREAAADRGAALVGNLLGATS